jgi:sodium-dependent dicarboxylate transporter 2/3/5
MGFRSTYATFKNFKRSKKGSKGNEEEEEQEPLEETGVEHVLRSKYEDLGPVTFHEASVFVLFVLLIILWIFRSPKFIKGWGNYAKVEKHDFQAVDPGCVGANCTYMRHTKEKDAIDDATAGMFIVLLLFILPSRLNFWPFCNSGETPTVANLAPAPALLHWSAVQTRMPWSIILLFGGGFALAKATDVSGLSLWLGSQLKVLDYLDAGALLVVICVFTAVATEFTSNAATCTILLPILRDLVRRQEKKFLPIN